MEGRTRLTPVGAVLLGLLALSIVAVIAGSRTLQAIGFVLIVLIVLLLIAEKLPRMRLFGKGPADTLPTPDSPRPSSRRRRRDTSDR
jgi:hypothetical protein